MSINFSRVLRISLNLAVIIFLVFLPYYLFEGRLFLGGDDTRLHYIYPTEFLKYLSLFPWVNISSLPSYLPNYHSIPFLSVLAVLDNLLSSKTQVFYFAFSLPFILGFLYFQKFVKELTDEGFEIPLIASLIYIASPITVISQMYNFLFSMYLVALIPIVAYYYACFVKRGKITDILKVLFWSILFSVAFYAVQWILGVLFILICGLILLILVDSSVKRIFKRTVIFFYFIFTSQLFWVLPFIVSLIYRGENDLGGKIASEGFANSFASTVLATATGNILYPLLTFYHRKIAFDYDWQLKNVFTSYFDYVMPFSLIFILVLFLGVVKYNQALVRDKKRIFIFFFTVFILVLYFSTVNIGFLKDLFLLLGNIPGFAIFRNFTDKFALAYIFTYSSLLALCLLVIKRAYKFYPLIVFVAIIVVFINLIPIKQIIVSPLWKTENVYTTVKLPEEYLSFTEKAKSIIPNDTNIIAFPQNISAYAIITEDNDKNAYVGTSPFKFFTGINDLTGSASYPEHISSDIQKLITKRDYPGLNRLLPQINADYLMVTNNIPREVLNSYLYDREYLKFQDKKLIESISSREVLRSEKGNYVIYKLKKMPGIITADTPVKYKKVSPIEYEITLEGLKGEDKIIFHETYHPGWKLYKSGNYDFLAFLRKTFFDETHKEVAPYGNEWTISSSKIKSSIDKSYYKENEDGSIDVTLKLYFSPQSYFYIGVGLTIFFLTAGALYLVRCGLNGTKKKSN